MTGNGKVSLVGFGYHVGRWRAGQTVDVCCRDGLVEISHGGVVIATHARRHPPEKEPAVLRRQPQGHPARPPTSGPTLVRKIDSSGGVSFAGTSYRVDNAYKRRQMQVAVVGDTVQITLDGRPPGAALPRPAREISAAAPGARRHPHPRGRARPAKEHGAFATPGGRPRRTNAAQPVLSPSCGDRSAPVPGLNDHSGAFPAA